jgi:hypothetical protein
VLLAGVTPLDDHWAACPRPHKPAVEGLQGSCSLAVLGEHHQATALQPAQEQHGTSVWGPLKARKWGAATATRLANMGLP